MPDFREPYRRVLFERAARESYLAGLQKRVALGAERFRLSDRVTACFG